MFDEWIQVIASDVVKLSQKVSEEFRTGFLLAMAWIRVLEGLV